MSLLKYKILQNNGIYFNLSNYFDNIINLPALVVDGQENLIVGDSFSYLHSVPCTNFIVRKQDLSFTQFEHECIRLTIFLVRCKHIVTGAEFDDNITSVEQFIEIFDRVKNSITQCLKKQIMLNSMDETNCNILDLFDSFIKNIDKETLIAHISCDSVSSVKEYIELPNSYDEILPHLSLLLERYICTSNNFFLAGLAFYFYLVNLISANHEIINLDLNDLDASNSTDSDYRKQRSSTKSQKLHLDRFKFEETLKYTQKHLDTLIRESESNNSEKFDYSNSSDTLLTPSEQHLPPFTIIHWKGLINLDNSLESDDCLSTESRMIYQKLIDYVDSETFIKKMNQYSQFKALDINLQPGDIVVPYQITVQTKIEKMINLLIHRLSYWHIYPDTRYFTSICNVSDKLFDSYIINFIKNLSHSNQLSNFVKCMYKRSNTGKQREMKIFYNFEFINTIYSQLADDISASGTQVSTLDILSKFGANRGEQVMNMIDTKEFTDESKSLIKLGGTSDGLQQKVKSKISNPRISEFINSFNEFRGYIIDSMVENLSCNEAVVQLFDNKLIPIISALWPDISSEKRKELYDYTLRQSVTHQFLIGRLILDQSCPLSTLFNDASSFTATISKSAYDTFIDKTYIPIINLKVNQNFSASGGKFNTQNLLQVLDYFVRTQIFIISNSVFNYLMVKVIGKMMESLPKPPVK